MGLPFYLNGVDGYSRGSLSCLSIHHLVRLLIPFAVIVMNNVNYITLVTVFLVVIVIFSQVTLDNVCFLLHKLK